MATFYLHIVLFVNLFRSRIQSKHCTSPSRHSGRLFQRSCTEQYISYNMFVYHWDEQYRNYVMFRYHWYPSVGFKLIKCTTRPRAWNSTIPVCKQPLYHVPRVATCNERSFIAPTVFLYALKMRYYGHHNKLCCCRYR